MRTVLIAAVVAIGLAPAVPGLAQAPAPKVQITFEPGGLVTLVATGATVREVFAEWTRQGGSTFVNGERLAGAPLTLQFASQPEKDVLASLLRQASGFILGPRRAGTTGASSIEVVYILPTSNASASGFTPPPAMPQPQQPQFSTPGSPDDELPPVQAGRGGLVPSPGTPPSPSPSPSGTSGVAVPVVVVPVTAVPPPTTTGRGRGGGGW